MPYFCRRVEGTSDARWAGSNFPWATDIVRANKDFFGNATFRLNQKQTINASMSGRDCFVMMPTGGGTPTPACSLHQTALQLRQASCKLVSACQRCDSLITHAFQVAALSIHFGSSMLADTSVHQVI